VGVVKRRVLRGLWRRLVGVRSYGLYTVPLAALVRPIAFCAAFTLPGCVLREISGGAPMCTPGGAGTRYATRSNNPPVLGAPASLIGSELYGLLGAGPSLCPYSPECVE
jgi:hypothetical protein